MATFKAYIKIVMIVAIVSLCSCDWNDVKILQTTPKDTVWVNNGDTIRCKIRSLHILRWCWQKSHSTRINLYFNTNKSRVIFDESNISYRYDSIRFKYLTVTPMYESTCTRRYECFIGDSLAFKKTDTVYFKNIKFVSANDTSYISFPLVISEKMRKHKKSAINKEKLK